MPILRYAPGAPYSRFFGLPCAKTAEDAVSRSPEAPSWRSEPNRGLAQPLDSVLLAVAISAEGFQVGRIKLRAAVSERYPVMHFDRPSAATLTAGPLHQDRSPQPAPPRMPTLRTSMGRAASLPRDRRAARHSTRPRQSPRHRVNARERLPCVTPSGTIASTSASHRSHSSALLASRPS